MDEIKLKVSEGKIKVLREQGYEGKNIIMGIRPENIHDEQAFINSTTEARVTATIEVAKLMGVETYLYLKVNAQDFIARVDSRLDSKLEKNKYFDSAKSS